MRRGGVRHKHPTAAKSNSDITILALFLIFLSYVRETYDRKCNLSALAAT